MKKFVAGMLCFCMMAAVATACNNTGDSNGDGGTTTTTSGDSGNGGSGDTTTNPDDAGKTVINLYAFTEEVPMMCQCFLDTHPDFAAQYTINKTVVPTTEGQYQPALDQALLNGGADAPDMYVCEEAFIIKYTQGDMASYAAPYEDLGIDVDAKIEEAQIAQYTVDCGTNPDGKVVALGYQTTGGAFIYRRSLANEVFGTDDPDAIAEQIGAGTNSWDAFWDTADELAANDIAIVSSIGDMWNVVKHQPGTSAWVVDGALNIDPNRESFLDIAKTLIDEGYCNDSSAWQDSWFADMQGIGEKPVFGFFGPAWLVNYTIAPHSGGEAAPADGDFTQGNTYGDWAVCESPVGFFWGGSWVLCNNNSDKKEAVGQIIEWITLDCSNTGLQYYWANGMINTDAYADDGVMPEGTYTSDSVASAVVMDMSDGSSDFLGGQNMFEVFVPANTYASGEGMTQYDETINSEWQNQASYYAHGEKDRDAAIEDFQTYVSENLGL